MQVTSFKQSFTIVYNSYVLHIASPVPIQGEAQNENEIMKAAVTGTTFVLKACLKNNVEKVVLTSCTDAICNDGKLGNKR
jgi:nucleoside-diphosphate-sugar epimerase